MQLKFRNRRTRSHTGPDLHFQKSQQDQSLPISQKLYQFASYSAMDNVDSFDVWSLWWQAAYIGVDDSSAIGLEPDIDFGLVSEYSTHSSSPSYSEEEDFNKGNGGPETTSAKCISRSTSKSKPRQTPYTDTQLMVRYLLALHKY